MSRLTKLLPDTTYNNDTTVNAQGRIPRSLYARVDAIRKDNKWTWNDIMCALFENFCDEIEKDKKTA